MMKFINSVNRKEEARHELERWGLQLDASTIEVSEHAVKILNIRTPEKNAVNILKLEQYRFTAE